MTRQGKFSMQLGGVERPRPDDSSRPYDDSRPDAIVRLSLRAWKPDFQAISNVMDPDVYREQHPDWRVTQRNAVGSVCAVA